MCSPNKLLNLANEKNRLTNKKLSLPVVSTTVNGYIEDNVSLCHYVRHNANSTIRPQGCVHVSINAFSVKPTTAQHITCLFIFELSVSYREADALQLNRYLTALTYTDLHLIFMPGMKQGPVMLMAVPPSMLALSGANTKSKLAPAVTQVIDLRTYIAGTF